MRRGRCPGASVGSVRTPPPAIVCATEASCSGVASVLYWPMAVDASSSGVTISPAGGSVLGTSPGSVAGWFQPNCSASSTSFRAPTRTPSGAKTELQECAKLAVKSPPQDSPLAFSSSHAVDRSPRSRPGTASRA